MNNEAFTVRSEIGAHSAPVSLSRGGLSSLMKHGNGFKDITGKTFGRLTVVSFARCVDRISWWRCRCECGAERDVRVNSLTQGRTKSCGCYRLELLAAGSRTTHGASRTKKHTGAYRTWAAMRSRCLNPHNNRWSHYGGRGIKVCARWLHSFENFLEDMGERPAKTTIERKDNDGDYCKANCVWATSLEQGKNKRNNHLITLNGVTKTLAEWIRIHGFNPKTIHSRVTKRWPERDLFKPLSKSHVCSAAKRLQRRNPFTGQHEPTKRSRFLDRIAQPMESGKC